MYMDLSSDDWTLEGYMPMCHRFNFESGIDFSVGPIVPKMRAVVPGSVHDTLGKAGLLEPVTYELNSLKCEWVENKCWAYERSFTVEEEAQNGKLLLVCEGLNFEARVYLNGALLGIHRNVHTPAKFDLTGLVLPKNILTIVLEPIPRADGQMGRSSTNRYQCERFGYGWDFCTALIGVGIWKKIGIYAYDSCLLDDVAVLTDTADGAGWIDLRGEGYPAEQELTLEVNVKDGAQLLYSASHSFCGSVSERVLLENPKLWYPNGYGSQPLYTVQMALLDGGRLQDVKTCRVGIRHMEFSQNDNSAPDSLPYTVFINNKKIWLKAAVFLPIDQRLGKITAEDYRQNLLMMKNANITMLRLWGGGVCENEVLFDLCDEYGILVWQDFTQSNAGIDGVPSEDPEFLQELKASTVHILKQNRSHTCQTVYIGGNELRRDYSTNRRPVKSDNPNIRMLSKLVEEYDPIRVFHPSSPSGPNFDILFDEETRLRKRNHNTHGSWSYLGKEGHYDYYNKTDYLYQGEFGVNGAPDESTMRRIFSEETLSHFATPTVNWHLRNIGWWHSYPRDIEIFGAEKLDAIEAYVAASQLIQAEGLRYTIERNRARAFQCSGCCIWQFNEPFPNPNCTNLVDFFGLEKMAYSWVQRAYAPTTPVLKYNRLFYRQAETAVFDLGVSHFAPTIEARVTVNLRSETKVVETWEYCVLLKENTCKPVDRLEVVVTPLLGALFFLEVIIEARGIRVAKNLYSFGTDEAAPYAPFFSGGGKLDIKCTTQQGQKQITMTNTGNKPCYFVGVMPAQNCGIFLTENNFVTVFPREEETITVACNEKTSVQLKDFTRKINRII